MFVDLRFLQGLSLSTAIYSRNIYRFLIANTSFDSSLHALSKVSWVRVDPVTRLDRNLHQNRHTWWRFNSKLFLLPRKMSLELSEYFTQRLEPKVKFN